PKCVERVDKSGRHRLEKRPMDRNNPKKITAQCQPDRTENEMESHAFLLSVMTTPPRQGL
ncbi:hypothetical protein GWI33_021479, partial [Rhynchophorus ferrugineus]